MNYDIVVGSLNINQNSMYSENKLKIITPYGTHCVAGAVVNSNPSSDCPNDDERLSGISATEIDTTEVCQDDIYVCSDESLSCPAANTPASSSQGDFSITQDDGPVQFMISGSSTPQFSTFNPFYGTFSVTSQASLTENKENFSSEENDPRIYLYEVVSPNYEKMWVHSGLKQCIQARPWLLSVLSLTILRPNYLRQTLIHIPNNE